MSTVPCQTQPFPKKKKAFITKINVSNRHADEVCILSFNFRIDFALNFQKFFKMFQKIRKKS